MSPETTQWTTELIQSPLFQEFIDAIPEAVIFSNQGGQIVQVNLKAVELFKYNKEEFLKLSIEELVPDAIREKHPKLREWFFKNPRPRYIDNRQYHLEAKRKDETIFSMDSALFVVNTEQGPLAVNLMRDVSEEKQHDQKLSEFAFIDTLTHLPNRRFFDENFAKNFARATRHNDSMALLFIDLDKFKPINDTFGHDVGDIVLQEVANRIAKSLRTDDFVARIGGDEFIIMLYPLKQDDWPKILAKKIISLIEQPIQVEGADHTISASIGIAKYNKNMKEAIELFRSSDMAMYQAKKNGGGQFFPAEELDEVIN